MWDEKEASLFQFYFIRALFDTELLSKHEGGSVPQKQDAAEDLRGVCINFDNSPSPLSVSRIKLCKHGKSALLLLYNNSQKRDKHVMSHTLIQTHLSTNVRARSISVILLK